MLKAKFGLLRKSGTPESVSIGEKLIGLLPSSRIDPDHGGTVKANLDNCLDFTLRTVPDFLERISTKDVLDFGCGLGWQSAAIAQRNVARSVTGLDIRLFNEQAETARKAGVSDRVSFVPDVEGRQFDVVYSCSAFEHFSGPEAVLRKMIDVTRPGGQIIITWAEPWWSPNGSHMTGYTGFPWSNVWFSEKTLMRVRSKYRSDGAQKFSDVEGGLNQMTIRRFEKIIGACGVPIEFYKLWPVRGMPLVSSIPVVREFWTAAISCVLRKVP
ncbi:MAG: class I SAM-dependent methyltransferase [Acidobacteriota bacterium]|nr:class I SAM-dependent methyltransferase [Acidobacteriota bacterium]